MSIFRKNTIRTFSWNVDGTQFQARPYRGLLIVNFWPLFDSENDAEGTYVVTEEGNWDFNDDEAAGKYIDTLFDEMDTRAHYVSRAEMEHEWRAY